MYTKKVWDLQGTIILIAALDISAPSKQLSQFESIRRGRFLQYMYIYIRKYIHVCVCSFLC